jgi:hypothetical protein
MKKKLALIFALFLFAAPLLAQSAFDTGYNPKGIAIKDEAAFNIGYIWQFTGEIDTTKSAGVEIDSLTSNYITVAGYNDANTSLFFEAWLDGITAAKTKINAKVLVGTTVDGPWTAVQTICTNDSVETQLKDTLTTALAYGYPYLKLLIYKGTGNITTTFDFRIVAWKKDQH